MEYYSDVTDGKLQPSVAKRIATELPMFNNKRVRIVIEKLTSKRSHQQNKLWWVYINILSKELGYSKDETHEICKFKFLKREMVIESTGELFPYIASTAKLNKTDFADVVNELIQWAAEMNIILPLPGEQLTIE